MGCPIGFVLDPTGAVCVPGGDGTDPTYFNVPGSGDITYGGDPPITPPNVTGGGCYIGETDPLTGDTIAGCGGGETGGGITPPGSTVTPVSPGVWQQIGGTLGAFLGGFTKTGGNAFGSVPAGSKRCPNGQIVLNAQACPNTASVLGSGGGTAILLLAVLVVIIVMMRK